MNCISALNAAFAQYIATTFAQSLDASTIALTLNTDENKQAFGDLSSTVAMALAKKVGTNPRAIAQQIATEFSAPEIANIEIAGPGFLNFYLTDAAFNTVMSELTEQQRNFFKDAPPTPRHVSIEFVSANPTGPLHFGHGRGGIIGDVLGNVLRFLGHTAIKEFYINDAGSQISKLGMSFKIRCAQLLGHNAPLPEDAYHGEYLIDAAQEYVAQHGTAALEKTDAELAIYAKEQMLAQIRKTLDAYGISYDVWFSEKTLHDSGAIAEALELLKQRGFLYEKEGALWFSSTVFGDDKDRVVRKANGELTYAAADIAYLRNKIARGSSEVILILGHDHHSYAIRLEAILKALGLSDHNSLTTILYQLVKLKEGDKQLRMSKRAGNIITLDDVIEAAGTDVARFFYLNRKADAQLEFDLELALRKTEENPVYYLQYAYVRINSIIAKAAEHAALQGAHSLQPCNADEKLLLKKVITLKGLLADISTNYQTHLLAYYAHELAQSFSRFYSKNRVIDLNDVPTSCHRLTLITIVRDTLGLCFDLMGISKPERM